MTSVQVILYITAIIGILIVVQTVCGTIERIKVAKIKAGCASEEHKEDKDES